MRVIGKAGRGTAHAYSGGRPLALARFVLFEADPAAAGSQPGAGAGAGDDLAETVEKLRKELQQTRDEAAKNRIKARDAAKEVEALRGREAKVVEKLGVDSVDAFLTDDQTRTTPPVGTPPASPEVQAQMTALEQRWQKKFDQMADKWKAAEEGKARIEAARENDTRQNQIKDWMLAAGVIPERVASAMFIQEGQLVRTDDGGFEREEDTGRVLQWYVDPKSGERVKAPLSDATVGFNIPPEFLPAKGGPGSGGGPPNPLGKGAGKDEMIGKAKMSQREYEAHRDEVNAKLRGSQAS